MSSRMLECELTEPRMPNRWSLVKDDFWQDLPRHGRMLLKELLEGSMRAWREEYVEVAWHQQASDRRDYCNGFYERKRWPTPLGPLPKVRVPRCRGRGLTAYMVRKVRRGTEAMADATIEMVLSGVSTRRVGELLDRVLALPISAGQVSRIAKGLDEQVRRFHSRAIPDRYVYGVLDAIHLKSRSTPRLFRQCKKVHRRTVLVFYGVTAEGIKELVDFLVARSESQANWQAFLWRVQRRGLTGDRLRLVVTDGCKGLCNAVEEVWPHVKRQRCWFHRMSNVGGRVRRRDVKSVLEGLRKVYTAEHRRSACRAFKRWADRWGETYGKVVSDVEKDLEPLLAFFGVPREHWRMVRTTNGIERCFREVRRKTRSIGTFVDDASIERLIYGLFAYQNRRWERGICKEFKRSKQAA